MQITYRLEFDDHNAVADFAATLAPQVLQLINKHLPNKAPAVMLEASETPSITEVAARTVPGLARWSWLVKDTNSSWWVITERFIRFPVHKASLAGLKRTMPQVLGVHPDDIRCFPTTGDFSADVMS